MSDNPEEYIKNLTNLRILKITSLLLRKNLKLINNVENNKIYEEISERQNFKEELIEFMNIVQDLSETEFLTLLAEIEDLVESKNKKIKQFDNNEIN